jgi:hypothetical protein
MKRTLLVATVIMASVGASSAEQDVVSPEQKRVIETIAQKYFDAINTGDVQRAASFFQPNGFLVGLSGMIRTQGLADYFDKVHKMGAKVSLAVENIEPVAGGKALILTGNFTATSGARLSDRGTARMTQMRRFTVDSAAVRSRSTIGRCPNSGPPGSRAGGA